MASVWCMYCYRRKDRYSYICHKKIFYLSFSIDIRLSDCVLFIYGVLDQCKKLHQKFASQSGEIFIMILSILFKKSGQFVTAFFLNNILLSFSLLYLKKGSKSCRCYMPEVLSYSFFCFVW